MASNKKRIGLDKPTRDTLSALDRALLDLATDTLEKQPNEFTFKELMKAFDGKLSRTAIQTRVTKLVNEGKWKVRCVKNVNYYSKALQNVTG